MKQAQRSIYNYELVKYPTLIVDITGLNKPRQFNEFNYKINRELIRTCPGFSDQFSLLPLSKILDVEGLFTSQQFDSLERSIVDFIFTKEMDLLIVSMDEAYPSETFEELASTYLSTWNVGSRYKKGGILILLSKANGKQILAMDDRAKAVISEDDCRKTLEKVGIPSFEKNNYFRGLFNVVEKLKHTL